MINEEKLLSLLGLAQKAGKIVSGEVAVEKAVRNRSANLLLIAADSSSSTLKNYSDMATYYSVPIFILCSKSRLGESIGKMNRAALAVTDIGFSKAILKLLPSENKKK